MTLREGIAGLFEFVRALCGLVLDTPISTLAFWAVVLGAAYIGFLWLNAWSEDFALGWQGKDLANRRLRPESFVAITRADGTTEYVPRWAYRAGKWARQRFARTTGNEPPSTDSHQGSHHADSGIDQ